MRRQITATAKSRAHFSTFGASEGIPPFHCDEIWRDAHSQKRKTFCTACLLISRGQIVMRMLARSVRRVGKRPLFETRNRAVGRAHGRARAANRLGGLLMSTGWVGDTVVWECVTYSVEHDREEFESGPRKCRYNCGAQEFFTSYLMCICRGVNGNHFSYLIKKV